MRGLVVLAVVTGATAALAEEGPRAGRYAITTRLELPHVERWAVERTEEVCLRDGPLPIPVLSRGTGLAGCSAEGVRRAGRTLSYGIRCAGRDATRAEARYELEPEGFRGRVAIVMGAKNMTMTEMQTGRWLGPCAGG